MKDANAAMTLLEKMTWKNSGFERDSLFHDYFKTLICPDIIFENKQKNWNFETLLALQ